MKSAEAKAGHFEIDDYLPNWFQIGAGNSNNKRHHEEMMSDDIDFEEHIPDIKRERRSQSPTSTSQPTALEIDNFIGKEALKIYDQFTLRAESCISEYWDKVLYLH